LNRKKKNNSFNNIRPNIYNQRVDNNITKQFREIHNSFKNHEYITDEITDADGLERAYQHGDYYIHGDTMYIAGSHTAKDWYDDVTKIPVWGDLRDSTRYKAARDALLQHPEVKTVIGHSLGGSVALELEKNYNHLTSSRTYGAPVWNPLGSESNKVERYRNWIDPVSVFDRSAVKSVKWNPFESTSLTHDYGNIAKQFTSEEVKPTSTGNPDGTVSLIG
jgi:hypothetical protein